MAWVEWPNRPVEIVKGVRDEGVRERGGWVTLVGGKGRRGGPRMVKWERTVNDLMTLNIIFDC